MFAHHFLTLALFLAGTHALPLNAGSATGTAIEALATNTVAETHRYHPYRYGYGDGYKHYGGDHHHGHRHRHGLHHRRTDDVANVDDRYRHRHHHGKHRYPSYPYKRTDDVANNEDHHRGSNTVVQVNRRNAQASSPAPANAPSLPVAPVPPNASAQAITATTPAGAPIPVTATEATAVKTPLGTVNPDSAGGVPAVPVTPDGAGGLPAAAPGANLVANNPFETRLDSMDADLIPPGALAQTITTTTPAGFPIPITATETAAGAATVGTPFGTISPDTAGAGVGALPIGNLPAIPDVAGGVAGGLPVGVLPAIPDVAGGVTSGLPGVPGAK